MRFCLLSLYIAYAFLSRLIYQSIDLSTAAMKFAIIFALTLSQLSAALPINNTKTGNAERAAAITWYDVDWPLGDASWKETDDWFEDATGISRYALCEQTPPRIFQYALDFTVSGSGFGRTYTFEDLTGHEYSSTVFTDGDHSVDNDSCCKIR